MLVLAKATTALLQPLALVAIILALGIILLFFRSKCGRWICAFALAMFIGMGWMPLAEMALRPLEQQFAVAAGDLSKFAGIVVLGGAIVPDDGRGHGQLLLGGAAERVTESLRLLRQYPQMRMVYSGGDASLSASGQPEADLAEKYFRDVGVGADRAMYERLSRNTFENATMSRHLIGKDIKLPWLLVTSAAHMPRAYGTFARAGWNVTAYPVDFVTTLVSNWADFSLLGGAELWRNVLREYVGFATYSLAGRL